MTRVSIYVLVDPREPEVVRYVGKTCKRLSTRLSEHIKEALNKKNRVTHKLSWLRKLSRDGVRPSIVLIARVKIEGWEEHECHLIAHYKDNGHPLTNLTTGGEGLQNPTPETRKKIGLANRGKVVSVETRKRLSLAMQNPTEETRMKKRLARLGRVWPEETRKKIRLAHLGRVWPAERRAKHVERMKKYAAEHPEVFAAMRASKKPISEETRKKLSVSHTGRKVSEETRRKIALQAGWKHTPEALAKIRAANKVPRHLSDEGRARLVAAVRGRRLTPEARAKISAARVAYEAQRRLQRNSGHKRDAAAAAAKGGARGATVGVEPMGRDSPNPQIAARDALALGD